MYDNLLPVCRIVKINLKVYYDDKNIDNYNELIKKKGGIFMSYISEIFERLDLQSLREFLLHGIEPCKIDSRSYLERLETAEKKMRKLIHTKCPKLEKDEKIMSSILAYASQTEDVYMEIGLQCGFILAMQILKNEDRYEIYTVGAKDKNISSDR